MIFEVGILERSKILDDFSIVLKIQYHIGNFRQHYYMSQANENKRCVEICKAQAKTYTRPKLSFLLRRKDGALVKEVITLPGYARVLPERLGEQLSSPQRRDVMELEGFRLPVSRDAVVTC
jgi:hypothetical protein